MHGGWLHLLGNCWFLWIFADNVEDRLGHIRFLLFYLLCGLGAGILHFLFNAGSLLPAVGASGAISGILGAYFVLFPYSRVLTVIPIFFFWRIVELPAFVFLGLWFIFQFFSGLLSIGSSFAGGVAWWAHVGGFIIGILLLKFFLRNEYRRRNNFYYIE